MKANIFICALVLVILLVVPAVGDGWFGRADHQGSVAEDIEDYIKGGVYFGNGSGNADSINIFMEVQYASVPVRCALYQRTGGTWTLIDSSAEQLCPIDTGWVSFPLLEHAPVMPDTQYAVLAWADQSPQWNCRIRSFQNQGNPADSIFYKNIGYGVWPSPTTPQLLWHFDVVAACYYSTPGKPGAFPASIDRLRIRGVSIQ